MLTRLFAEVLTLPLAPASVRARELGAAIALPGAFDAWFAQVVNRDPNARIKSTGQAVQELAVALGVDVGVASSGRALPSPRSLAPTPVAGGADRRADAG